MLKTLINGFMVIAVAFSSLWASGCACYDPDDEFPIDLD